MVLLAVTFDNLHQILQNLYVDMMPLCSQMTGVAKGLAGLGALFYIAYRVWQSLARAEPVDVFPLLRPFALGLCIMFFPTLVLGTLNSVLSPVVTGTHNILETQTFDMNQYRAQKDKLEFEAMKLSVERGGEWLFAVTEKGERVPITISEDNISETENVPVVYNELILNAEQNEFIVSVPADIYDTALEEVKALVNQYKLISKRAIYVAQSA